MKGCVQKSRNRRSCCVWGSILFLESFRRSACPPCPWVTMILYNKSPFTSTSTALHRHPQPRVLNKVLGEPALLQDRVPISSLAPCLILIEHSEQPAFNSQLCHILAMRLLLSDLTLPSLGFMVGRHMGLLQELREF